MKTADLAIVNAVIVNEGRQFQGDIVVMGDRIAAIGSAAGYQVKRTIDAAGRLLLPGVIDDQVHFREPGATHKATIGHESAAAVAGGVTSFMEMPNTNPPTLDQQAIEHKLGIAAKTSHANYAFYLGASNTNLDAIRSIDPSLICGVKVFMGASTGNMLVDDPTILNGIFADAPTLVATHCEDTPMILALEEEARLRYGEEVPFVAHARIRSREACYKSSSLAIELAKRNGTNLHVLHLTTAEELAQFTPGPLAGKRITAEVCVHHLYFTDQDYADLGSRIKCNPSIKEDRDRQALRQAVRDNRIDIFATDHAPHTLEEKSRSYFKAPAGLPLVQFHLVTLLEMVKQGVFDLETVVTKAIHNPATRYGVVNRGFIREGYYADLVLVDPQGGTRPRDGEVFSLCCWTPFHGRHFSHRVDCTIVNGQVAYEDGQLTTARSAQRLEFLR